MNYSLNIMILEDDIAACKHFQDLIDQYDDLAITTITNDSYQALDTLKKNIPEAIILDLELNEGKGNGLMFLQQMNKLSLPFKPYILVTTNNSSSITLGSVRNLGADFIMSKHQEDYSEQSALDFLNMMKEPILTQCGASDTASVTPNTTTTRPNYKKIICHKLDQIGINAKMLGYTYLSEAILLVLDGHNNNLCATIGQTHNKTASSIERAMQNAIKSAWRTNDIDDLLTYYTAKINPNRGVPTLTEFIYYYANQITNEMD